MRTLMIAAMLIACNTTETTETEDAAAAETVQIENTETTFTPPIDVVDEEAKRTQQLDDQNFDDEGEFTTEDNSFEEAE